MTVSVITQINILIDNHPGEFAACEDAKCKVCKEIRLLSTKTPKRKRKPVKSQKAPTITEEQLKIAEQNGISKKMIRNRIKNDGMTVEEAISKPRRQAAFTKEELTIAQSNGISRGMLSNRLSVGWDKQRAITEAPNKQGGKQRASQHEAG